MDIFTLKALVDDMQQQLIGARVSKVYQMSQNDMLLRLWQGRDFRLFLSAHTTLYRLHLTSSRFDNPQRPPRFAAFLRAHLEHARLRHITMHPYDRVVNLVWEHARDATPVSTLIHELTGRQANIILVDQEGTILDALKYTHRDAAHRRPIRPGQPHQPLLQPSQRLRVSDLTLETLLQLHQQERFDALQVQRLLIGVDAVLVTELFHRSQSDPQCFWELFCQLRQQYEDSALTLSVTTTAEGIRHLCVLPLTYCAVAVESFTCTQEAAVAFYEPAMQDTHTDMRRREVQKLLRHRQQKLQKKKVNLQRDYQKLQSYLPYQHYGTLLVSQRLPRGSTEATVIDYYHPDQPTITISLDPRMPIRDNAQVYFKKYRKAKSGLVKVQMLLDQCTAEARRLEGLAQQIAQAKEWSTLNAIAGELTGSQHPVAQQRREVLPPRIAPAQPYRRLVSRDGYTLYCGKSNRGNDTLLRQIAAPDDIWLHAHQQAGAHVIVKVRPQEEVPWQTLTEAAALAAYYSKGKHAAMVEVIYTCAKHVQKFRGAHPGEVRVSEYRTLEVVPYQPIN